MRSTAARFALPAAVALVVLAAVLAATPAPAVASSVEHTATFTFDVRADGSARVTVTTRYDLANQSDRKAFDQLAQEHESGSGSPLSMDPFRRAVTRASEATGRPMRVQDVVRTANRANGTGRLDLSFTWTNFSNVSDGRLYVGDAFRTPSGTWLPGLSDGQALVISFPPGYSPQSISVPDTRYQLVNGTVHVEGPASFQAGTPAIVLQGPGGVEPPPQGDRTVEVAAAAAILVLLLVLAYLLHNRIPGVGGAASDGGGDDGSAPQENADGGAADAVQEPDPMADPLLSDEERILRLLDTEGGRMKQVAIVEATDWSNAKVSQLLSEMAEEGRVEKLRIGRENLISLPGRGPGSESSTGEPPGP